MPQESKSKLEKFKERYAELQAKHNLPSFEKLNQDFHIEKLCRVESDYLIREIKKFMAEKLQNYSRFIESVLNPTGASMFIYSFLKTMNEDDKKTITDIYKKLSRIEIELIELDVIFSEQKDMEFVKSFYETWQGIKKDMVRIIGSIKKNWDKESQKDSSAYLG